MTKHTQIKGAKEVEEMAHLITQLPHDEKLTLKGVITGFKLANPKNMPNSQKEGGESDGG